MNFVNKDIITWCHNFFLTKQHFFGFFCRVILFCVWQQFLQVGLMHFPNLFCKLRGVENMDNLKYIIIKPCLVYKYDTETFSSKISTCHCCRSKYYELRKNFIWTPLKAHWVLFFYQRSCDASKIEREYLILRNGKYGQTHKYSNIFCKCRPRGGETNR